MNTINFDHHYQPAGDQPKVIQSLCMGLRAHKKDQVLLGITGSGKTFTVAQVIAHTQRPALIMAPNKTLAAQLYAEMKDFFPHNAVEYFVSYYDYYQPEAYLPRTDTYIEKEASINERIDRLRHSATRSLLERRDVIVIASVSCIYGIGAVESYGQMVLTVSKESPLQQEAFIKQIVTLQYKRNNITLERGHFRVRGDVVDIFPAHYTDHFWRIYLFGETVEEIWEMDHITGKKTKSLERIKLYANSHHVTPKPTLHQALNHIKQDLKERVAELEQSQKLVEAQRLSQRISFDIEMMVTTGHCNGIENYSRYLTGRQPGEPPPTLFDYLPKDALLFVDESHITVPQIRGMYRGDAVRKKTLSEYGFRLPSCRDNRPLKFEEWEVKRPQTVYVSATPGPWELTQTNNTYVAQMIRPTGLLDPICHIHPTTHQVDDLIARCQKVITTSQRILVTTLTKKMAEALTGYLNDAGLKTRYLHSDINTLERITVIEDLRQGVFDILVGINLLREGLDIPECALVAILDADKPGFLRSHTSLIQTIGRASRNINGHVVLYADQTTNAMRIALAETKHRRTKQLAFNQKHNITPKGIIKKTYVGLEAFALKSDHRKNPPTYSQKERKRLEKEMHEAAKALDFERAASLRDQLTPKG